jgi:hypothetical protein
MDSLFQGVENEAGMSRGADAPADDLAGICIDDEGNLGNGVQPGVHATLGPPDLTPAPPFLARRLDAVRCALR